MILAALLLAAAPAAAHPARLAGTYEIDQMEMAGGLELTRDGHFRYAFDYGAASEIAEGDWTSDGKTVRLTSNPMPKEPAFTLLSDTPAPAGELYVAVAEGNFSWSPLTAIVTMEGAPRPVAIYAQENGRVRIPEGRRATAVQLKMPVYEAADRPVPLSADRGHRLLFRLDTNDAGQALFRGEALAIDGRTLVMRRYDAQIIFRPAKQ
jgi:hypothetical protein